VVGVKDKYDMMRFDHSGAVSTGMFDEDWRRFVVKMATGAGKTKVMSLVLAWSYFHKLYEPESELARNFLVITPNIIVLDRIYKDFQGLRIFFEDPVLPDNGVDGQNWRDDFQLTLHVQDEVRITHPVGNIFLTNIHRVYSGDDIPPSSDDEDTMDYFLGKRPTGATTDSKVDLGMIVRDIDELMVLNDEAHHIHDSRLAWFKSIEDIHNRLKQKGDALSLQIDVTATPKHNNGGIFVQTIADYPLVEAISQNVVKHPVVPDAPSRAKLVERQSAKYTEKYADYINLGVVEWRKAYAEHEKLGKKAILFVMTDDTKNCDDVGGYLEGTYPELTGAVLVIHTKNNGEISESATGKNKDELEMLRQQANEIDGMDSPYKAIVSVLMLKEGWDVRNVTTIVGLRAYAARATSCRSRRWGAACARCTQLLKDLRLVGGYDVLYPKVRDFMRDRLFAPSPVDLEDPVVLRNLSEPDAGKILYDAFKSAINALTIRETGTTRIEDRIRLREARPFRTGWRQNLPAKKSVFNTIVGEPNAGNFELRFAGFLEAAPDVQAFAKNYLAVGFKLDYVRAGGDLANYHPDFIVRTTGTPGEAGGAVWLVETKGREERDLPQKMARLRQWCADATAAEAAAGDAPVRRYDFVYVDQTGFETHRPTTFAALAASFTEFKA
jgi:hypothetical protein